MVTQERGFDSRLGSLSVRSLHICVCVGFLRVLQFPPTVRKTCWLDAVALLNSPLVYPNRRQGVAMRGFSQ